MQRETNTTIHPRRHILFPTVAEVKEDPRLAYSDHLPILTTVPLKSKGFSDDLRIISLNTLASCAPSGLHQDKQWETPDEAILRYNRIVEGLASGVNLHKADVISLQETDEVIVSLLQEKLGDDWVINYSKNGMITAYNKKRFDLQQLNDSDTDRVQTLLLKEISSDHTVEINNVWGFYDPFPNRLEENYKKILNESSATIAILIGDTNSRVAPLDNRIRNSATGIVPVNFNENNGAASGVQITDYPDGAFYRDEQGIHQLNISTLDFKTGQITEDTRTEKEVNPWNEYRMVLCLDQVYQTHHVVNNQTIFEYEATLKKTLNDQNIITRVASDSFNNKAIGIKLPRKFLNDYAALKNILANQSGFQFKTINSDRVIFATLSKAHILQQALINRGVFKSKLNEYSTKRSAETKAGGIWAFFRNLSRLNGKVKTSAAGKLMDFLDGKKATFSAIEIEALTERGSDLGSIVAKFKQLHFPLPPQIMDAYTVKSKKINHYGQQMF